MEITIDYGQLSKKGRLIFGEESEGALQPYKYWRLGASPDTFEITLNSETDVFFGAVEPNYDLDVLTIEVPVQQTASEIETFTIQINSVDKGAIIQFGWADTQFKVPVSLQ